MLTAHLSNGFNRFQLGVAAEELLRRGMLGTFFTGAYPSRRMSRTLLSMSWPSRLGQYAGRRYDIDDRHVVSINLPEVLYEGAQVLGRSRHFSPLSASLNLFSMREYGAAVANVLRRSLPVDVFHYRAGFGGDSVRAAQRLGSVAVCDHSICYPSLWDDLIGLPAAARTRGRAAYMRFLEDDTGQADLTIVNSSFVADTFEAAGQQRPRVLYWGIDDQWVEYVAALDPNGRPPEGPLRLLFAGRLERRKGAIELATALLDFGNIDWRLSIAGAIDPSADPVVERMLKDSRVQLLGRLRRTELAKVMNESEILIFPTRAEGSARVVFEALAAGCFVVTTIRAGSIVTGWPLGQLIEPGEPTAITAALEGLERRRGDIAATRPVRQQHVLDLYNQSRYGEGLVQIYKELVE